MQGIQGLPIEPDQPVELEDRAAPRFTLLIRTAKLVVEDRQYLCVVRDISASGASIRSFHELPEGKRMAIEFQNGDLHPVELIWQKPGEAGFQFLVPIEVDAIVAGYGDFPKRDLRFDIELPVTLNTNGRQLQAQLVNLSRQGGSIETSDSLMIDQPIRMEARGVPEIEARVRWRKDGCYGLVFDTTFSLANLAILIRNLHGRGERCQQSSSDRRADNSAATPPSAISHSR